MLTAGAPKCYLQVGESALYVARNRCIDQSVAAIEKRQYFTVVFKEHFDGSVASVELFVWFISPGVVDGATVKNETAAIARRVFGQSAAIGK